MMKAYDINHGLSTKAAEKLLIQYGENVLAQGKKLGPVKIFVGQFKDLMTMILLVATAASVFMGETTEAITIVLIVFLNAILGFIQEYRTEKTLDALRKMSAPNATVIRDGLVKSVPSSLLVVGDVILLKTGDKVPADGKVVESVSLMCDESILTGESLPVEKQDLPVQQLEDIRHENKIFRGTVVTKGRGKAIVTATGMSTEMGKIARMIDDIEEEKTPLQVKLDQLGKYLAVGCLGICAIVSVTGIFRGEEVFDMIVTGISLAVAAIPEGLTAIVTIALALAVRRILKRNALVRKLHAVETLGCANIICSDKTGTLTENKMTVKELYTLTHRVEVTGNGFEKAGGFVVEGRKADITASPVLSRLLDIAVRCNASELVGKPPAARSRVPGGARDVWEARGEPTEIALLVMAAKADRFASGGYDQVVDEIPFDSTRKRMSVIVQHPTGQKLSMTKGAPDFILDKCTYYMDNTGARPMTPQIRRQILDENNAMAEKALRVIAFAYNNTGDKRICEENMVFVGLSGMLDPPRKEAYNAVRICRRAHIKPVMITGDHKLTAVAIARDLRIYREGDLVLTGKEIDAMGDSRFESSVGRTTVFARVNPAHKLKIVKALKRQGNIVAMTGDGVNDAPAIKEADIGVAMGVSGTDVTREASSLILLDDNFATLVAAVEEGRVIYTNIRKFIRYLLSCNVGEVITMFVGMIMGMPVVLLPIQILFVNLVTDGLPAMALGVDPPDEDVMGQMPRRKEDGIFAGGMLSKIIFRGLLIGFTTLAVFVLFLRNYGNLEIARTGALLTLVLTQLFHVFECKSETKPLFRINIFNNLRLIGAVLLSLTAMLCIIYIPFMQSVFETVALSPSQIGMVFGMSILVPALSTIAASFHQR